MQSRDNGGSHYSTTPHYDQTLTRKMASSYAFFFVARKAVSSDQAGKDTHVSLSVSTTARCE
jgi:hypothetical protein